MEKLLNRKEAAQILGVHPLTLYTYTRQGKIPCVRFGEKTMRYRPEDLRKFVADHLSGGQPSDAA